MPGPSAALTPGPLPTRLGPYELLALVGRGGMGEVYRARDTRLTRTVAIKVLPPALSDSPEARARFESEARAIASLSHPHVCIVHDVGNDRGLDFIVMEYLDGESLAARLRRGPLPLFELLQRGIEIVSGLEHAHATGIVHRDVKPANIMLTRGGAKLLDFGLAALRPGVFDRETLADARPALAGRMSGTLQYMAPEQVQGEQSDARTDLFACGLVLYEMATGRKAFDGPSSSAIIEAIRTGEPLSIRDIQPTCSVDVDWAIRRCLARAPQDRWQTAADLGAVLRWIQSRSSAPAERGPKAPAHPGRRRRTAAIAAATVVAAAGAWLLYTRWPGSSPASTAPPVRSIIPLVADAIVGLEGTPAIAMSRDGRRLAYAATVRETSGLYVRRLDRLDATLLAGTEGATSPFFSPDGRAVGFFASGKLKIVSLDGGSPRIVCDAPRGRGGSWESPNTIVFAPSSDMPLFRVDAGGGQAEAITTLRQQPRERSHRWPEVLPGGQAVVFTAGNPTDDNFSDAEIIVQSLADASDRRLLVSGAAQARYAAGYLVYLTGHSLAAVPFDLERLQITGAALTLVDGLSASRFLSGAQFALSREASLVYLPPGGGGEQASLVWVSRTGAATPVAKIKGFLTGIRLAPDGARIAVNVNDSDADIRVYDGVRGTFSRVTFTPGFEGNPVWTPDGNRIAFASERGPGVQMFWKRWNDPRGAPGALAQPGGQNEPLAPGEYARIPQSWSPDGRYLAFTENHPETRRDIWILPVGVGGKPYPLVTTPFEDAHPVFSPDGRWLAYHSNESGGDAVYVRPVQQPGPRILASTFGGVAPRWAANGELFYRQNGRMVSVTLTEVEGTLKVQTTQTLFEIDALPGYDVAPDGQRFLMLQPGNSEYPKHLVFVREWREELRR